jgi:5'-phosphate synthase pdxT subunit
MTGWPAAAGDAAGTNRKDGQVIMNIGVLALQGAFAEHIHRLRALGVGAFEVRLPDDLADADGLIIPGGESTVIGKLAQSYALMGRMRRFARTNAVWGTCAGMILMARNVGRRQPLLGIMDITVERNAFGRQVDSFEIPLTIPSVLNGTAAPFPAVFIRAPKITAVGPPVEVLATLPDGSAVAARQGRLLVTAFHPELTDDDRLHRYFLRLTEDHAG